MPSYNRASTDLDPNQIHQDGLRALAHAVGADLGSIPKTLNTALLNYATAHVKQAELPAGASVMERQLASGAVNKRQQELKTTLTQSNLQEFGGQHQMRDKLSRTYLAQLADAVGTDTGLGF